MSGIQWLPAGSGRIHANAVQAGCDKDGGPLYVGRAYFRRNLLPAKIAPNHQTGYVSFEGAEHRVVDYEVLVTTRNVAWQSASGGRVPKAALPVGRTMQGETLYTGRVEFNSTLTPGKIQPSHGVCYIPFDGLEHSFPQYNVLVVQ